MRLRILALAMTALLALAPLAPARAILLTLDPAAQTVNVGDAVTLELNISGLGDFAAPSLGAWDVEVGFDQTILSFTGASLIDQLDLFGLGSFNGVFDLGGTVNLFEVSLDPPSDLKALQPGAFTLATLTFDALAVGTSAVSIALNALGDADGVALSDSIAGASVTVTAPLSVPEPETALLFLLALAGIAALRRYAS